MTPTKTGIYFDKIQCFCFSEQRLGPGRPATWGSSFFVDPDMLTDPNTREVRTITLSYTMFRARVPDAGRAPPRRRPRAATRYELIAVN